MTHFAVSTNMVETVCLRSELFWCRSTSCVGEQVCLRQHKRVTMYSAFCLHHSCLRWKTVFCFHARSGRHAFSRHQWVGCGEQPKSGHKALHGPRSAWWLHSDGLLWVLQESRHLGPGPRPVGDRQEDSQQWSVHILHIISYISYILVSCLIYFKYFPQFHKLREMIPYRQNNKGSKIQWAKPVSMFIWAVVLRLENLWNYPWTQNHCFNLEVQTFLLLIGRHTSTFTVCGLRRSQRHLMLNKTYFLLSLSNGFIAL